jgi:hypothetical protein
MKTPEEILKKKNITPDTIYHSYDYLYNTFIKLLEEGPEWISKEDDLPEFKKTNDLISATENVILYSPKFGIGIGWWKKYHEDGRIVAEGNGFIDNDSTHWLPLNILGEPK